MIDPEMKETANYLAGQLVVHFSEEDTRNGIKYKKPRKGYGKTTILNLLKKNGWS